MVLCCSWVLGIWKRGFLWFGDFVALMALHCINLLLSGSWDLGLSFSGLGVCRFRQANEDKEWRFEVLQG